MRSIIRKWIVSEPESNIKRCIVALHGRGIHAETMMDFCAALRLPDTLIIALEAYKSSWYPLPNGALDQDNAIIGLSKAANEVYQKIKNIKKCWNITNNQLCILGYSAGSVVALDIATKIKTSFNSVVSLAGAIFECDKVPKCKVDTKILLQHNKDDDCFDWTERYCPMYESLSKQGYNISTVISDHGGHNSFKWSTVESVSKFLVDSFNITEFFEPDILEEQAHEESHDSDPQTASS